MIKKIIEEKRRKEEKEKRVDAAKKLGTGIAVGSLIGGATGLLLAPKDGKELRKDISHGAKSSKDKVKSKLDDGVGAVKELVSDLKCKCKTNKKECIDCIEDKE